MKKALITVSFGTMDAAADARCIQPIVQAVGHALPEYEIRRAYSSGIIIEKLRHEGREAFSTAEVLQQLRTDACEETIAVPLFMIRGGEYEKVVSEAHGCAVSEALLENEADLEWMAGLLNRIAAAEGRSLLMMGHGSSHAADHVFTRLQEKTGEHVHLACLEGACNLETLLPQLTSIPERLITLMPLMLVAGTHAQKHMAGTDSWKTILESLGFDVRIRMQGLGELPEVQQHFAEKAAAAIPR